jgi:transketolase N-terminal domain/subunit
MTSPSASTAKSTSVEELRSIASQVRRDIVRMVHGCQSGHPGGSLGCTDFLVALYFQAMRHDAEHFTMDGIGEDLFSSATATSARCFTAFWREAATSRWKS